MMCTEANCGYTSKTFRQMKDHYLDKHPHLKNFTKYFTREAKKKK